MEVTYQLERDDYWQYNTFVIGRVPALKRQTIISAIIFPAIITFDLWLTHIVSAGWLIASAIAVCVLWVAFLMWTRKRAYLKTVEAKPGSLGLHTLSLGADGVREQSDVMEGRVKWPKVSEVAQNKHLIVFFVGPRYGFIVPKRAFPTPQQAQAFLETAQAYRASALNGTAPVLPPVPETWPPAPQRIL